MPPSQSLAPRQPASLETVHNILGSLVARYRQEEVLTAAYNRESGYRVQLQYDVQVRKAITLFPDAEKLAAAHEQMQLARRSELKGLVKP